MEIKIVWSCPYGYEHQHKTEREALQCNPPERLFICPHCGGWQHTEEAARGCCPPEECPPHLDNPAASFMGSHERELYEAQRELQNRNFAHDHSFEEWWDRR